MQSFQVIGACSEPCQTPQTDSFAKIINGSILDVLHGFEYVLSLIVSHANIQTITWLISFVRSFVFRSSHQRFSIEKAVLNNFAITTGKHLCWSHFLIQLQAFRPATLLKSDSNTSFFLWILRKFWEHLFWSTSSNGCFFILKTHLNNENIQTNQQLENDLIFWGNFVFSFGRAFSSTFDIPLFPWLHYNPKLGGTFENC